MSRRGKKSKVVMTRRQMMRMLGGGGFALSMDPVSILLNSMVDGFISKAQAQTASDPNNIINFYMNGGWAQWAMIPLKPWASSMSMPFIANGQVLTAYEGGQFTYKTVDLTVQGKTYTMPAIWGTSLPTWNPATNAVGTSIPMSDLFKQLLMVRGIKMNTSISDAGHTAEYAMYPNYPNNNVPTIAAGVAAHSVKPLAAVGANTSSYNSGGALAVPSNSAVSQTSVDELTFNATSNPLTQVQSAFSLPNNLVSILNSWTLNTKVSQAQDALRAYAGSNNPGADALYGAGAHARQLMNTAVGGLIDAWSNTSHSGLYDKYKALVDASKGISGGVCNIPGVLTEPIPATNDIRSMVGADNNQADITLAYNTDMRSLIDMQTRCGYLAESFALAEYLMVNGLSSAFTVDAVGQTEGMGIDCSCRNSSGGSFRKEYIIDEHDNGPIMSLVCMAFLSRAYYACLNELIKQLQAANMWDHTLIQLSGDFGRSAHDENVGGIRMGKGSDHAAWADVLFCTGGMLPTQPICIGNIAADDANSGVSQGGPHRGTWGLTAKSPRPENNSTQGYLTGVDKAATLAALLNIEAPVPNSSSFKLVGPDNNGTYSQRIPDGINKPDPNS